MNHPVLFLIGQHGVGKSTVGGKLAERGWHHMSMGDLGRLVRQRKVPRGYRLQFLSLMAGQEPGAALSPALVQETVNQVEALRKVSPVVVDGFPSAPEHLQALKRPRDSYRLAYITCPEQERLERLIGRSLSTKRQWRSDSQPSLRDQLLDDVFYAAIEADLYVLRIGNTGSVDECVDNILQSLDLMQDLLSASD